MSDKTITNPDYFRSYGLEQDPFPDGRVDDVYYATPELEHRLELVKHLVDFSERILLLVGVEGVGKSAFLKRLKSEADDRWKITELAISGNETPQDVIESIYKQNLLEHHPGESMQSGIEYLGRHFNNNVSNNLVNVLLVDDANLLTASVLNLLLQFARPGAPVHLVMVSAEDISSLFVNQGDEFLHKMDLPVLTENQIRPYLKRRLGETGKDLIEIFTPDRIKQIHKTSGGLPVLINQLAARALQDPSLTGLVKAKSATPLPVLRWLFNGRVTLIASLVLVTVFVVIALNKQPAEEKKEVIDISLPEPPAITESTQVFEPASIAKPVETIPTKEVAVIPEQEIEPPEPAEIEDHTVSAKAVAEPPKIESRVEESVVEPEPAPEKTVTVKEQPPIPAAQPEPRLTISRTEPEDIPGLKAPEPVAATPPKASAGLKGPDWLLQQPAEKYVLQLMGAHDPQILTQLLSNNPSIYAQVARFTTVNNNKPWHVLVYGLYPDRDTAVEHIGDLPGSLKALGPWPRSLASIHKDLK